MRDLIRQKHHSYKKPALLAAVAAAWLLLEYALLIQSIPDHLFVSADGAAKELLADDLPPWVEEETAEAAEQTSSDIPQDNLSLTAKSSYTVQCSLLGVIPIKDISVDVVERRKLIPSGMPVGIYMKTDGVLIVGTGEVCDQNGDLQEPGSDIVCSGDYILAVDGVPVSEKEEVTEQISKAFDGSVTLAVMRDGKQITLTVPVVQTKDFEYKAGIWIRDDTQGIGTLTWLTEDGYFGALGHGISDVDTSTLLSIGFGSLYRTRIQSVIKGENGAPGELSGTIRYAESEVLGSIDSNTGIGIFGKFTADIQEYAWGEAMEIAYRQEVKEGAATILSAVDGEVKEFEIEIEKVNLNSSDANKSMVIRVTDQELLELTGGIVQGMSGSPILQDGRIVGAVTHVFVNDPAKGYGIFIENMLQEK